MITGTAKRAYELADHFRRRARRGARRPACNARSCRGSAPRRRRRRPGMRKIRGRNCCATSPLAR
ncbi:MAG: hypothetical protein M0C28_30980 [Candidatus Moduliflexus flocculans]|nr:hypothetical protein [Candidatus Moduliflexus flocculans]